MRISLAEREAQLMEVLWDRGPSLVNEVQAALRDELAYTTVLTMLRKLEAKGYVGHAEEGRAHRYHALIDRGAAREGAISSLVSRLFKGSSEALLLHLVEREKLSQRQVQRIEEQLRKVSGKEKS
ncbi:MAG TPA: BlaI/MecI/CopY family transcriptional regulator [Steroidobacteraceae bacterium]|nr:BlaI/MecI/CopY family transcriptional regulator [Steroidobacteraceae bacterium]